MYLNAGFEFCGALLAIRNLFELKREKPTGVYWPMLLFSGVWAIECVGYYQHVGDTWSCIFAVVRCAALIAWSSKVSVKP